MYNKPILFFFLVSLSLNVLAADYSKFFTSGRIRMNYSISGAHNRTCISNITFLEEEIWGGSTKNLIDTFRYGHYMLEVYDKQSEKLIYSRGYSNLFQEWQTTEEAKLRQREFKECIIFPRPIKDAVIKIFVRDTNLVFQELVEVEMNISELNKVRDESGKKKLSLVHGVRSSDRALDIVFISEGYTNRQKQKFYSEVKRFKENLFEWMPYSDNKDLINIWALFVPSKDKGVDMPADSIWKETAFDCTFSTFGIDRYLSVPDITKVYDELNGVPFDQVCVLVNSDLYGGGGIYNFYNVFTSGHESAGFLFVHEFGHGFAGLADEYFSSGVAYENFARKDIEPIEPNITTLVDFSTKWKTKINDTIPIPTPDSSIYKSVIGVFEGAAYQAKDVFRPAYNCAMRSSTTNKFCEVCQQSIEKMLLFYGE